MLRRTFDVDGAWLELTLEGMSFGDATGELEEVLEDLEENGLPERTGGTEGDAQVESVVFVPATVFQADEVERYLEEKGFTVDERPPGGGDE